MGGLVTTPDPWWLNNPKLIALREAALADLERRIAEAGPREPHNERDVVIDEMWNGVRRRELVDARKDLARARTRYDDAVLAAREAGLSWGQIGVLLGVSEQQLHRRFRARNSPRDLSD
jgi:DNA-directed RNA polymerase specialized sigma24 family protein